MDVRKALFQRGRRRVLEIGLVGLVCALAAGAVIGSGLAQTVLATPSPLTWLRNAKGQVVQVNPETGTMLQRLRIGNPGDPLTVVQDGSHLVVTNLADGTVTVVDLSMLQVAGTRQGDPQGVKVVLAGGQIYLANKRDGQIEALDPLSAAPIGQPYETNTQLTDVVADSTTALWALTTSGRLVTLRWSATTRTFTEEQRHDLPGAGPGTALVAHQQGITAVTPTGQAIQVGTGHDRTIPVRGLTPPLAAADTSPTSLVPVTSTTDGTVHLVRDNGAVAVDGPPLGCPKPDKPAVYRNRVYVPCRGDRKVIVLDQDGHRSEPDLDTQGDAELVLNAGLLFLNVPTAKISLVVKPDGTTQPITTDDPTVTVNDPDARPTALPSGLGIRPPRSAPPGVRQGQDPAQAPAKRPGQQAGARPGPGRGSATPGGPASGPQQSPDPDESTPDQPSPSLTETSPSPRPEDFTPTGVSATARNDGQADVTWNAPPTTPASYQIVRTDTGQVASEVAGAANATIVGDLTPGVEVSFVVVAVFADGGHYPSARSKPIIAYGRPGQPTVSLELVARSPARITLRVTVQAPSDGGRKVTSYDLSVTASTGENKNASGIAFEQQPYQFTLDCTGFGSLCLSGGTVRAAATLYNEAGAGPQGESSASISATPQFAFDGSTMFVTAGGECLDYSLTIADCNGSTAQLWSIRGTGEIRPQNSFNQCLSSPNGLHYTTNCGRGPTGGQGPPDDQRWTPQGTGNVRAFKNQDTGRCLAVNGDPAAAGAPVKDLGCRYNNQDQWYLFTATLPLTAAQPASFTPPTTEDSQPGGLGAPAVALLLLPLAAGLVRQRQRRRHAR